MAAAMLEGHLEQFLCVRLSKLRMAKLIQGI